MKTLNRVRSATVATMIVRMTVTTPYAAAPRTWDEVEAGAEDLGELVQLRFDEVLARAEEHGDLFGELLRV